MKTILMSIGLLSLFYANATVIDVYDLTLTLKIPHVQDNYQSLGTRRYKSQRLAGTLTVKYEDNKAPELSITGLKNLTYKINGTNVQYVATIDNAGNVMYPRWNMIGSNKTNKFTTPSVFFFVEAIPSYAIGTVGDDNSLYLSLAGTGTSATKTMKPEAMKYVVPKTINGYVTGTQGCGCADYGHVSPTRLLGMYGAMLDYVDDVAAVLGTWRCKHIRREVK